MASLRRRGILWHPKRDAVGSVYLFPVYAPSRAGRNTSMLSKRSPGIHWSGTHLGPMLEPVRERERETNVLFMLLLLERLSFSFHGSLSFPLLSHWENKRPEHNQFLLSSLIPKKKGRKNTVVKFCFFVFCSHQWNRRPRLPSEICEDWSLQFILFSFCCGPLSRQWTNLKLFFLKENI